MGFSGIEPIRKVLIANRGEIARRIQRTCRRLGIRTVAVYSEADRGAPFVREADEAYVLSGQSPAETYLNIDQLLAIADRAGADAIHPGYGFLSENADFARAVAERSARRVEAGLPPLRFVGPHPEAIARMGSKAEARALMQAHGIPTPPGYYEPEASPQVLQAAADRLGYPVLLKAAAGGGGKGMRIVSEPAEFVEAFQAAQREALHAFGSGELLLERYFPSARHIEVQLLGDKHGHLLHLFERECSLQRRYQKVWEEAPSPVLSPEDRKAITETALQIGRLLAYDNAGTVEFLYVGPGQFYFLEVNTRLQVEHPVTEAILGLDIVEWQLRVAAGEALPFAQEDLRPQGHAIEVRLYAEDPGADFQPSAGRVLLWRVPDLPYLRIDSGIESGTEVSPLYDPLLAKIIAHGPTREETLQRLAYGLSQITCLGLRHNLAFLELLCQDVQVQRGEYDTNFLGRRKDLFLRLQSRLDEETWAGWLVGLSLWRLSQSAAQMPLPPGFPPGWRNLPDPPLPYGWQIGNQTVTVAYRPLGGGSYFCQTLGREGTATLLEATAESVTYEWQGRRHHLWISLSHTDEHIHWLHEPSVGYAEVRLLPRFPETESTQLEEGRYLAPMPGQILQILVKPGDLIEPGQPLLVFVSMKMENRILATKAGRVEAIFVSEGQTVDAGTELLKVETFEGAL
jgi:acetyl/propionyl-CoA carboxylase alpha subunit